MIANTIGTLIFLAIVLYAVDHATDGAVRRVLKNVWNWVK